MYSRLMTSNFFKFSVSWLNFFSPDSLRKFVKNVLAGNLKPYLKSEPVPETQGNVKVMTLQTYHFIHGLSNLHVKLFKIPNFCTIEYR